MKCKESRIRDKKDSNKDNESAHPKKGPTITEWLTIIAISGTVVVGFLQYKTLKLSVQQVKNIQRAFVLYDGIDSRTVGDFHGSTQKIILDIKLKNSGAKPTRNLLIHVERLQNPTKLPDDYTFPDTKAGETVKGVFGPHSTNTVWGIEIPVEDVKKIAAGSAFIMYMDGLRMVIFSA
jgi:hypothetical protein